MEGTGKMVDYSIIVNPTKGNPLTPCCDKSKDITAVRAFRVGFTDAVGYVLESTTCDCPSRWLTHDWKRYGDAAFVTLNKETMINRGDTVTVVKGKKVPLGTSGVVFWTGSNQYGERIGFKNASDGETVWISTVNVTANSAVPAPAIVPTPAIVVVPPPVAPIVDTIALLEERVLALETALAELGSLVATITGAGDEADDAAA